MPDKAALTLSPQYVSGLKLMERQSGRPHMRLMEPQSPRAGTKRGYAMRNQLVIPVAPTGHRLVLVVSRGPSLELERIHAWLHVLGKDAALGPLMGTFDAELTSCVVIRDVTEHYPTVKLGQASFRIDEHSAQQLKARLGFSEKILSA